MKKKHIFLALIISLFAAGSIINMHLAENHHNMDVSLTDIVALAQADGECNLCVVKKWGLTVFSCEPTPGINNCSTTHSGGVTLRCDNATEC